MIESAAILLTVLTPLVAVPLTIITFYLRSLRDHQLNAHAQLIRRVEAGEATARDLQRTLADMERDYTTKEEWLRECMHLRRIVEHLTEVTARIESTTGHGRTCRPPTARPHQPTPRAAAHDDRHRSDPYTTQDGIE
ncbi:MAG: hypothetical protein ACE5E6_12775 [Phycisphaerae bacterium]